jgi:hypothetical protein
MSEMIETRGTAGARVRTADRGYQAYRSLHLAFIVAPTLAGLDKFFHLLVNWDQYLAPQIAGLLPVSGHTFMLAVGVIEMAAGLLVALKPRIGAYVVAAWLAGIIVNLVIHGGYLDIALRDLGLMLGALALGRLSQVYDRGHRPTLASTEV